MSDTTHYCPQCVEFSTALLQAQADLVAAVGPSEVVVSRTDLERVLTFLDGGYVVLSVREPRDRLRAVLNQEGNQ